MRMNQCYLPIFVLDYVPPFTIFSTCCFKFRACQLVPVLHTGFFSFFPIFLLIRIICVCIGRTLLKSNSECMVAFPQGSHHFHLTYWFLSELGSEWEFPLLLTLLSGKWNYQQGRSRNCQCFAFWGVKVSADTLKLKSLTLRYVAAW